MLIFIFVLLKTQLRAMTRIDYDRLLRRLSTSLSSIDNYYAGLLYFFFLHILFFCFIDNYYAGLIYTRARTHTHKHTERERQRETETHKYTQIHKNTHTHTHTHTYR